MKHASTLEQLAHDIARVIPDIDTSAAHERWQPGIGALDEPQQVAKIVEALQIHRESDWRIRTEVSYPNSDRRCDLLVETSDSSIPLEAKLLRFFRDNGDLEPAAYDRVFSPFTNSLVTDAQKLAQSRFESMGGLLGLYYEPKRVSSPHLDATKLAEKVSRDVAYWQNHSLDLRAVVPFDGLRHPVHQRGAVIAWELVD